MKPPFIWFLFFLAIALFIVRLTDKPKVKIQTSAPVVSPNQSNAVAAPAVHPLPQPAVTPPARPSGAIAKNVPPNEKGKFSEAESLAQFKKFSTAAIETGLESEQAAAKMVESMATCMTQAKTVKMTQELVLNTQAACLFAARQAADKYPSLKNDFEQHVLKEAVPGALEAERKFADIKP